MNSNRLRYFIVLAETESIRKAAEILHISPAALSKAIKQLETDMDLSLLVPSGRGILITDEGKQLANLAKPLLKGLGQLKKELKDKTKANDIAGDHIRIGTFEVFSTHFLSRFIAAIPHHSELSLYELLPGAMEKSLMDYKIDYGITYIPIPTVGVLHQKIACVEMRIFGNKQFIHSAKWDSIPFVIPVHPLSGAPTKVQGLDGWPDGTVERFIKYRVGSMESALELCRQGKAVAYLPSFVVSLHNNTVKTAYHLHTLAFPKGMSMQKQTVYLAKRKTTSDNVTFKEIAQILRSLLTN